MINIQEKKEDFIRFSYSAFENKELNKNEEAAIQARKAGEVYMKIILSLKSKQSRKLKFNDRTGYKELVILLKENSFVTNQDVNLLESIQIIGNKASHDARIIQTDANYSINALKILVRNLFLEKLDEKIPPRLKKYLDEKGGTQHLSDQVIKLQKEINKLRKEAEDKSKAENLPKEKQVPVNNILGDKIEALEQKLHQLEVNREMNFISEPSQESIENLLVNEEISVEKTEKKKRIYPILIVLVFVLAFTTYLLIPKSEINENSGVSHKKNKENITVDRKVKIGILPLQILEDNKVVKLDFEKSVTAYLKEISKENNWETDFRILEPVNFYQIDSLKQFTSKEKLDLLIYGDLKESMSGDSAIITLKYIYSFWEGKRHFYGKYDSLKIGLGNPEALQFIKRETSVLAAFGLAIKYHFLEKHQEALNVMEGLHTASVSLQKTFYDFKYDCYKMLEYFKSCEILAHEYLIAFPDSLSSYLTYVEIVDYKNSPNGSEMDSILKIAESINSKSSTLWYWKGRYEMKYTGSINLAKEYFKKSVELDTTFFDALKYYAYMQLNTERNFEMGRKDAIKLIKLDSLRYDGYQLMGDIEYQNRQFLESIKWHKKALKTPRLGNVIKADINIQIAVDYYNLFLSDIKYKKLALKYYDLGIKYAPENEKPNHMLAKSTLLVQSGDTTKAEKVLNEVVKLNPDHEIANENLLLLAESKEDRPGTLKYAKEIYRINPKSTFAMLKIGTNYLLDDNDSSNDLEGLNFLNKVISIEKKNHEPLVIKGQYFLYKTTISDSAKKCFEMVLKIKPDNLLSLCGLADIYANKHKYSTGLIYAERALKINSNIANANLTAGVCYVAMATRENLQKAFFHLSKVLSMQPDNATANLMMSQVFINGSNNLEAKKYYEKAILINPKMRNMDMEKALNID